MEECRLTARDLACRRGDRVLFAGLNLKLGSGQACQVVGPNGMGKSSLIRVLAGLLRPMAGTVERHGMVGLLDERPALDEHLALGAALGFWSRLDPAYVPLDRLGLDQLLDVPVRYLSTGQRKRAALARLIGQQAQLWLLDEPLNGLDTQAVALTETLVAEHCANGGAAIIASHQPFKLAELQSLELANFSPPLQGRGRGWGLSASAASTDSPHPNPSPEEEGL